jgi:thiosulfate dehydrogenase (quinone) large subunit
MATIQSVSEIKDALDPDLHTPAPPRRDRELAYFVFRLTLGLNILVHGLGRLYGPGGADGYATKTAADFARTFLPVGLVHGFLLAVPFMETALGTLLTLGLLTRWALTLGGLLMAVLVFGTAVQSNWPTVSSQMIYALTYYLLLVNCTDDRFSLDTLFHRNRR